MFVTLSRRSTCYIWPLSRADIVEADILHRLLQRRLVAASYLQLAPDECLMVACHNFDLDAAKAFCDGHPFLSDGRDVFSVEIYELVPVEM